ncbi:MAG TPA: ATP-binding protein [Myxococcaceae bacterium]|nr:ATP-binding protein [Myxococcaceae bacterium]
MTAHYGELAAQRLDRFLQLLFRVRLGPPFLVLGLLLGLFAAYDPEPWRLWALGITLAVTVLAFAYYLWRYRHRRIDDRAIATNILLMTGMALVIIHSTGGIESPLAVMIVALTVVTGTSLPARPAFLLAAVVVASFGLAWLLDARGAIPHGRVAFYGLTEATYRDGTYVLVRWSVLAALGFFTTAVTTFTRSMYQAAGAELSAAREEVLRSHEDRIRTLEALGATIAHEVRNPLSTITGLAQLLRRSAVGESAEHLDVLTREADRLNAVLDEYLAFARPAQPAQLEAVQLTPLLDQLLAAFSPRLGDGRVRIVRDLPGDLPPARGDGRRLTQAFFNLIQNALDALDGKPGELRIAARARDGGVEASVTDTGPGLAPAAAAKLFTPFATTKPRGTGLGLVVARSAVRACGGTLTLGQSPGAGARAEIWLPRWEGSP